MVNRVSKIENVNNFSVESNEILAGIWIYSSNFDILTSRSQRGSFKTNSIISCFFVVDIHLMIWVLHWIGQILTWLKSLSTIFLGDIATSNLNKEELCIDTQIKGVS